MLSCPTTRSVPLLAVSILALMVNACARVPWQPAGAQLERIVPDGTVPLDQFGTFTPSVSRGCRFVSFSSESEGLVPEDHNGNRAVFLHDRETGRTVLISVGEGGAQANGASDNPVVSEDGSKVAFVSRASNLVAKDRNERPDVFLRYVVRAETIRLSVGPGGVEANEESGTFGVAISPDGSCVAFESYASNLVPGDGDGRVDVFVRGLR